MNTTERSLVVLLVAIPAFALILFSGFGCDRHSPMGTNGQIPNGPYDTNGEQIYFTCTSRSGEPILAAGGLVTHGHHWSCADCHGSEGRGRDVTMMMHSFHAPDIRYETLTMGHHDHDDDHPTYTDETIRRAITEGLDPGGDSLDPMMPLWTMTGEDLSDLLDHLKALN